VDTFRHYLLASFAACCLFASANAAAASNETNPVLRQPPAAATSQLQRVLVKLRASAQSSSARAQVKQATGATRDAQLQAQESAQARALAVRVSLTLRQSREITSGLHAMQVQSAPGESLADTLARLQADPAVEYAVADERRYALAIPSDPLYVGQWYLQKTQPAAIDAQTAWDTTTGRNDLVIADVDTGIRYDHPDLKSSTANRLLPGYDFVSDPTVANDGDGRDADASDPGDWISSSDLQNPTFANCTVSNSSWHGTRVVGILGAIANNAAGVAGITWQGRILPVRALGKCGGLDSDILDAMRWAAGLHVNGVPDNPTPAQIINLSLGSTGACTAAQQQVVNELVADGVLIVVSAGNEGGPVDSPANCNGVAGVAGLRNVGTKVGFSSLGPQIALSAPGGNCVNSTGACLFSLDTTSNTGSTTPGTSTYTDQTNPNLGTSFSAPMVAAIAGLMASVNGNLLPGQLIARLREGAKAFPVSSDPSVPNCHVPSASSDLQTAECNCTTQTCGAGMANAPGAVNAALRPIAAVAVPGSVSAGQNVVLQASGSAAACGHSIATYSWTNLTSQDPIQGANTSTATVVASGSFTVRLTVTDDAGRQDTADVAVSTSAATTSAPAIASNALGCPKPVTVTVSPTSASVEANGGTQTFTATVANTLDSTVTWQVNGVTGGSATTGTISPSGVYTAPASVPSPASVTVTAVSNADATKKATAQVTVSPMITVAVSPTSPIVGVSASQQFAATVANSSNTAVTWQVNGVAGGNSTVGTISSSGMYTAPSAVPSPATVTVTAVSAADTARTGTAQLTITPAASAATSAGSAAGSASSAGSGGGSGGGDMDVLTLFAVALAMAATALRRRRVLGGQVPHRR
jgi:serine protease